MTKFFSNNSQSYLDPEPSNMKVELARYYHTKYLCEVILKSIDKWKHQSNDKVFFSKNSYSFLDLEPKNLNVELARDILILYKCMKIH